MLLPQVVAHYLVVQPDAQAGRSGTTSSPSVNTRTSIQGGLRISTEPTRVILMDGWVGNGHTGAVDGR